MYALIHKFRLPKIRRSTAGLLALIGLCAVLFMGLQFGTHDADAQSSSNPPRITAVTVTSNDANSARIDATFSNKACEGNSQTQGQSCQTDSECGIDGQCHDPGVQSRLLYGPTTNYKVCANNAQTQGKNCQIDSECGGGGQCVSGILPNETTFYGAATSRPFSLANLQPGTTYHYKVEIRKDANSPTVSSADRTFTTKSGSAIGGQLVITNIIADCINTRCSLSFSTSLAANVQMRWDTSSKAAFNDYASGAIGETAGSYLAISRQLAATGLSASTTYHYRLSASTKPNPTSSTFLTNDLTFTTSASADDHTFTTGGCSDGTPIGQCSSASPGSFCENGGNLAQRCGNQCGFNCPSGQTCNQTQQCVIDPALTNSPYQCNDAACYEASGAFKSSAPAGCYASWPQCTANTILKVRPDRSCNLWLTCSSSVQLSPQANKPAENLCLSLAACNSLSREGQCNKYLPLGQCDNNPLRFCSTDTDCEAGGTCNNPTAEEPTRALQNITYETPKNISQIANLSGSVVAGLDWSTQGGSNVIQGLLPWQLMHQIGGNVEIENGDFESSATDAKPWEIVPFGLPSTETNSYQSKLIPQFEDQDPNTGQLPPDASSNRVLTVQPKPTVQNTDGLGQCSNSSRILCDDNSDCTRTLPSGATEQGVCSVPVGQCVDKTDATKTATCKRTDRTKCADTSPCIYPSVPIQYAGAASNAFAAVPDEFYYGEVRVRATKGNPVLRVQFGHSGYSQFTAGGVNTFVDVQTTGAWQRIGLGPLKGMSGETRLAVVCADEASCNEAEFQIDDAQVKPVLQVNTDPSYLTPSCRLYPKEDSPSCEYTDGNVKYKGWRGYCLEHDSVTGTCLSWWPVDILKGESGVFGFDKVAGYSDQSPLYYCAESSGNYRAENTTTLDNGYWRGMRTVGHVGNCPGGDDCANASACSNHGLCGGDSDTFSGTIDPVPEDALITEDDIYAIRLEDIGSDNNFALGTRYLTKDTSASAGAFAHKPYSAYWMDPSDAEQNISVWFEFDASTKHLAHIHIAGRDHNSDNGSFHWEVRFVMKEICTQLVQVVTGSGETRAFTSRVSSQAYQVPSPVGYARVQDLTPYGAVVPPADGGDDPQNWPPLAAEKQNTTVFGTIGQSRSGSPYACNGDCPKLVCSIDPNNFCVTADDIRKCQSGIHVPGDTPNDISDINGDGQGDGQCVGVGPGVTAKGAQNFSPTLDPALTPTDTTILACEATSKTCTANASVSGQFSRSLNNGAVTTLLADKCRNTIACDGTSASCPNGTVVKYGGVQNVQCSGTATTRNCTGQCTLPANPNYVDAAGKATNAYFTQQYLRRLFTQTYGLWQLTGGKYIFNTASATGSSGFVGWLPPTEICPKNNDGTPSRPKVFPQDYCAVPPSIPDDPNVDQDGPQFLTGTARQARLSGGSGTVGIKFNTQADADQLPLKHIQVAWGDGSIDTFGYPFAPRSDVSKPHVFSHVYVVNPTNPNCRVQANRQTVCTYPIKIQVEDNWGWCNIRTSDSGKRGSADVADNVPDEKGCNLPPDQWYDTNLSVVVEP